MAVGSTGPRPTEAASADAAAGRDIHRVNGPEVTAGERSYCSRRPPAAARLPRGETPYFLRKSVEKWAELLNPFS